MLSSMKGIRMSGLTPKLSKHVQQLRKSELSDMTSFRKVLVYCTVLAFIPQQISPVVTFGAFIGIETYNGRELDTTRLFTSVSLLVLLNQPLSQVFSSFPSFMSAIGCLERIQKYLSTDARADHRLLSPPVSSVVEVIDRPNVVKEISTKFKGLDDTELRDLEGAFKKGFYSVNLSS